MIVRNTVWLVAVIGVLACVGVARAQTDTPEQLKAEVERLKTENADLRTQIEALQGQLKALQGQIAAIRGQSGVPMGVEKLAPIPPDPLAAPAAMLAELIRRYERDLGSVLKTDDPPDDGSKATVEKWANNPKKEYGGKSYRQAISALATDHEKLVFEMDHTGGRTIREMLAWDYTQKDKCFEARYEELILDRELKLFKPMMEFLGFDGERLETALKFVAEQSLFGGAAGSDPARIRPSMAVTQPTWFLAMTGTTSPGATPAAANPAAERSTASARPE